MFGVIALVCGIVAAVLKLTNQHPDTVTWLIIIGLIAAAVELVWGWHRGGYYHGRA